VRDIVSIGRRVAVQLTGWLASQERAVTNARRASTEVSRRRVERDEVTIYLDALENPPEPASTPGAAERARTGG
jgi:hypothetical protein